MKVNAISRALELRKTLISGDKVLVTEYSDTLQGKDTSKVVDLMPNVKTGDLVFRAKVNVKQIDPIASQVYDSFFFDISKKSDKEIEDFLKKQEFDFPLWFKHNEGFNMKKVHDYNTPFILQVGGCNFHDGSSTGGCWYCFVDDKSNDGKIGVGKVFLGIEDTIDSMLDARAKIKSQYRPYEVDTEIKVLRVSGGEPTVVLDWILNLWRKINERGLDFVGQIDSNLSTSSLVDSFQQQGIYEKNILEKLAEHPVKVLTALKGTDEENLKSNVQSDTTMETQEYSLKKFLAAGFDIYPQLYNPNPATLEEFLRKMDSKIENLSLRIHIGPLKVYGPTTQRLAAEAERQKIDWEQLKFSKKAEWDSNYTRGCEIMNNYLMKTYGVGYKDATRSDVELKLKD